MASTISIKANDAPFLINIIFFMGIFYIYPSVAFLLGYYKSIQSGFKETNIYKIYSKNTIYIGLALSQALWISIEFDNLFLRKISYTEEDAGGYLLYLWISTIVLIFWLLVYGLIIAFIINFFQKRKLKTQNIPNSQLQYESKISPQDQTRV